MTVFLRLNLRFCSDLHLVLRNTCLAFKNVPAHGDDENSSRMQYSESKREIKKKREIETERN